MTETTKTTTNPTVSEPAAPKRRVGSLITGRMPDPCGGLFFLLIIFGPASTGNWC